MTKSILVFSERADDQQFVYQIGEHHGLSVNICASPLQIAEALDAGTAAAVFVDSSTEAQYQAFEKGLKQKIGLFSQKLNPNWMYYLNSEDIQNVNFLFQSPIFGHYIRRNYGDPVQAGKWYAKVMGSALADKAQGLDKIFKNGKIQIIKIERATQKLQAVEAVKNYLIAAKFKTRMATVISNAVDELLMNAIFDAPVDQLGKQIYAQTARNIEIDLKDRHSVEMSVGFDGDYVGITAADLFGSLDKFKLFSHISKRYRDEEYKIRTSVAGAGIGLASVFRSGGSFLFSCEVGGRTEVSVFFKRSDNFREFKDQFRFISTQFYF